MPLFRYTAIQENGQKVERTWSGASVQELYAALKKERAHLLTYRAIGKKSFFSQKLPLSERVSLCKQLFALLTAHLSLLESLEILAATSPRPLQKTLNACCEDIKNGSLFSQAAQQHPKVFDHIFVASLELAERTGNFILAFEQLSLFYEERLKTRQNLVKILRYPCLLGVMMMGLLVTLGVFVVPHVDTFLGTLTPQAPPLALRSFKWFFSFLEEEGSYLAAGISLSLFFCYILLKLSPTCRRIKASLMLQFPLWGALSKSLVMAEFLKRVGLLLSQKEEICKALETGVKNVHHQIIHDRLATLSSTLKSGKTLFEAFQTTGLFKAHWLKFIYLAEQTGAVGPMILQMAQFVETDAKQKMKALMAWTEPLLLTIMGGLVMWIVLATVVPIYDVLAILEF